MDKFSLPSKFSAWADLWFMWHKWLKDNDVSPLSACLAFPLSFPEVDRIIVGADNSFQLMQILSAASDQIEVDLPSLQCADENLINPANWNLT